MKKVIIPEINYIDNKIVQEHPWVLKYIPGNGFLESWRTGNSRIELNEESFPEEGMPISLVEKIFPVERGEDDSSYSVSKTLLLVDSEGEIVSSVGGTIPNPEPKPIPPKSLIERFLIWIIFGTDYPEYVVVREKISDVFLRVGEKEKSRVAYVLETSMNWIFESASGSANGNWKFRGQKLVIYKTPKGYKNFAEFVEKN